MIFNFHSMHICLASILFILSCSISCNMIRSRSTPSLPETFTYVQNENIIINLRYLTQQNFIGKKITGYKSNVGILTKQAAAALYKAAEIFAKDGYQIVLYDAYRPQKAVDSFIEWSENKNYHQEMKTWFFPRIDHNKVFELRYVAKKSGHTRGSTIDLTIIKSDKKLKSVELKKRQLADGYEILFVDDNTVDMGSSWDLLDEASHPTSLLVSKEALRNRKYLQEVMEKVGFIGSPREWWHYTLKEEPIPDQYFDFDVQ